MPKMKIHFDPRLLEDAAKDPELAEMLKGVQEMFAKATELMGDGKNSEEEFADAMEKVTGFRPQKLTDAMVDEHTEDMTPEERAEFLKRLNDKPPEVH